MSAVVHEDKLWAELKLVRDLITALGPSTLGAGAPAGTGSNGERYYDTTNKRAYHSDGIGWIIDYEPRQSWAAAPSWTVGDGTTVSGFRRHGGLCTFDYAFTFGGLSGIAGVASISLPVASIGTPEGALGCGFADLSGTNEFVTGSSAPVAAAGTSLVLRVVETSGTYARYASTSATIPFGFTTLDKIVASGTFTMNTPYL